MKLIDLPEAKQIASDLTAIKDRLGRLGLFATMHMMDAPLGKIGFEIEEHLLEHARRAADPTLTF
jgi:hypothetical protein